MAFHHKCTTCGFAKNGKCLLLKIPIAADSISCAHYQEELNICPICGQVIFKHQGTWIPEFQTYFCDRCGPQAYTCITCRHRKQAPACVMEQYKGDKPIFIDVSIRQGAFVAHAKHLNPEVLKEVCLTCTCLSPWECQRIRKCDNWEAIDLYDQT